MHTEPELLALLALGETIGDAERDHVASCAACSQEVAELSQLVGIGRTSGVAPQLQAPPQRVWDATVAELGLSLRPADDVVKTNGASVRPPHASRQPPSAPTGSTNETGGHPPRRARHAAGDQPVAGPAAELEDAGDQVATPRRGRRAASLVLAAALALVIGFGLGHVDDLTSRPQTIARTQLAALPSWPDSDGSAYVEQDRDGHRYLVITMHTTRPVDGSREVWLINSSVTSMRSLGYLNGASGRFTIPDGLDLATYPIVDVSREPYDDSDPAHSRNSIVRGTLAA